MKFDEYVKRFDDSPYCDVFKEGFFEAFAEGSVTQDELDRIDRGEVGFCVTKEDWKEKDGAIYRTIFRAKVINVPKR